MFGGDKVRRAIEMPTTAEKLRQWCLPCMADAAEADERAYEEERRRRNRDNFFDGIMSLAESLGAKVEVKDGNGSEDSTRH